MTSAVPNSGRGETSFWQLFKLVTPEKGFQKPVCSMLQKYVEAMSLYTKYFMKTCSVGNFFYIMLYVLYIVQYFD